MVVFVIFETGPQVPQLVSYLTYTQVDLELLILLPPGL